MESCSTFLIAYLESYAIKLATLTLTHSIFCLVQFAVCSFYYFKIPSMRLMDIAYEEREKEKKEEKLKQKVLKYRKKVQEI